jgi:hypothetical protein
MPITYRIDPERRVVYLDVGGSLSIEEVRDYRRRLRSELNYSESYDRVIDARGVSPKVSPADIRRLADIIRLDDQGNVPSKRAVILRDAAKLGLMQVFQAYTRGNPAEYRVFQSLGDAERWLSGRDPNTGLATLPPPADRSGAPPEDGPAGEEEPPPPSGRRG